MSRVEPFWPRMSVSVTTSSPAPGASRPWSSRPVVTVTTPAPGGQRVIPGATRAAHVGGAELLGQALRRTDAGGDRDHAAACRQGGAEVGDQGLAVAPVGRGGVIGRAIASAMASGSRPGSSGPASAGSSAASSPAAAIPNGPAVHQATPSASAASRTSSMVR